MWRVDISKTILICENNYCIAVNNFCKMLLGFFICLRFWFWIYQGSEYASVTQVSEYAWICHNKSWACLNMPEYAKICANVPESAWMAFISSL